LKKSLVADLHSKAAKQGKQGLLIIKMGEYVIEGYVTRDNTKG